MNLYWIEWLCISTKLFLGIPNHKKIQKRKKSLSKIFRIKFIFKVHHIPWFSKEQLFYSKLVFRISDFLGRGGP